MTEPLCLATAAWLLTPPVLGVVAKRRARRPTLQPTCLSDCRQLALVSNEATILSGFTAAGHPLAAVVPDNRCGPTWQDHVTGYGSHHELGMPPCLYS